MKLSELLQRIDTIAKTKGISSPLVCGGLCRDRIIGNIETISDIDLTTGDATIHALAKEVAMAFNSPNMTFLQFPDGHSRILFGELKLDFSSNFVVPGVDLILRYRKKGTSPLEQEMFSRDFTCNALLMSADLRTITDPTGEGIRDIKAKLLKTCLLPTITLAMDHKRVVRIVYLCAKLGFEPSDEIVDWVRKHPYSFSDVTQQYLVKKLNKAIKHDLPHTLKLLDLLQVWKYVPPIPALIPYMKGTRL